MKLSDNTLSVLKNFASINSGVVLNTGKVQKTISPEKSILVEATLEDEIPAQFGIYDLNQFLSNITLVKNTEITFEKDAVSIFDGEMKFNYLACSPNLVITPPDKELTLKNVDVKFTLLNSSYQNWIKRAVLNSIPNLSVIDRKSTRLNSSHVKRSRMPSSA